MPSLNEPSAPSAQWKGDTDEVPTATDLVWFVSGDNYVLGEQETPVAVFVYDPLTNEAVLDDDLTLPNQIGFFLSGTEAFPYFK